MLGRKVTIETGELQGVFGYDPRITVFKGVPYALPPVGELRWRGPQPMNVWSGVRMADHYGPISCQHIPGENPDDFWTRELHPAGPEYDMSEDCLYVNVFTPAKTGDEKLPVLVYIHGGGYQGGYPYEVEFDWEHMARKGIVVVAVTYRLGIMGFLTNDIISEGNGCELQGNYGLQDQLFAIKWTKKNIKAFGGDPEKITIAGQSAGAGAVQCLLASPMAEGLISGAIVQSGIFAEFGDVKAPINPLELQYAKKLGNEFFEKAGITNLEEARKISPMELIQLEERCLDLGIHFQPVVDGVFLKETPFDAMKNNNHHNVPVLAGYNAGEARGFMKMCKMPETVAQYEEFIKVYKERQEEIRKLYPIHTDEDVEKLFDKDGFIDLIAGTRMFGYIQSSQGREAYLYEFDADIPGEDNAGSFHGSELWFAYDSLARSWRPFVGKHYDLARQVSSYWVNFIKTGNPNGKDNFGNKLPQWKAFTPENQFIMGFRDVPEENYTYTDKLMKFRIDFALGR